MRLKLLFTTLLFSSILSCQKDDSEFFIDEDASSFTEIGMFDVGDAGSAEISAYDSQTKRLYVVNNSTTNKIDVLDIADPTQIKYISAINTNIYGGFVNSVAVSNSKLAAAIESSAKQNNGKVVVFNTADNAELKVIEVGALPDMVTFSPNGKFIITANEGEPNDDLSNNPNGSVSIISVDNNYAVTTLNFASFASQREVLKAAGLRVSIEDFARDMEPEYVTISEDSKTAWVSLQENNAIAKIDLTTKTITQLFPLGFKDYNVAGNEIDVSDRDSKMELAKWNVKGVYMPDALAVFTQNNIPYVFSANEGDAREYSGLTDVKRMKEITLDATVLPNAATWRADAQLGRLNIISNMGNTDNDADLEALYSFGSRSFSVWNGNTGAQVYDSKNELDIKAIAANIYDDGRSDDKSIEPEGITVGKVGNKTIAFVGMERVDAIALYDVTNPTAPTFIKIIKCGDAPEGVLFIPAKDSPIKKSLLVVSSEGDGVVKVFSPTI